MIMKGKSKLQGDDNEGKEKLQGDDNEGKEQTSVR